MAQSSPYQCADIKSSPERLACYDSFFAKNKNPHTKKNTPIEKKEEVLSFDKKNELKKGKQKDKSNEMTFGLSFKQLRKANLIPEKEEVKIFSSITKATKQITKKIVFRLENGHVWESESPLSSSKAGQFKKGTPVELEISRMGGFWMVNRSNNLRIKVIRVK